MRTRIEGQLAEDSYLFREICAKIAILPKIAIFREESAHLGARGPAGDDIGTAASTAAPRLAGCRDSRCTLVAQVAHRAPSCTAQLAGLLAVSHPADKVASVRLLRCLSKLAEHVVLTEQAAAGLHGSSLLHEHVFESELDLVY